LINATIINYIITWVLNWFGEIDFFC
jgi:hypothetical protein